MTNYPLLLKDLAKEVREKGTDLGLGEAFAEACLKGAEALEREEGWISVKDRLPEEDDEYLLYGHAYSDEDNNIFIGRFDDGQFGFWDMTCLGTDEFVPFASVLAWQPLPKPYEEETK